MLNRTKAIVLIIITLSLYSCNITNKMNIQNTDKTNKFKKIANVKYLAKINYLYNNDSTYVICSGKLNRLNINKSFFVYSLTEKKIVFETSADIEKVKWKDLKVIEYIRIPGIIQQENNKLQPTYIKLD